MVKVLTFLKRKAGMPLDSFQAYWRTRHPDVVMRLPGVRRYAQSHVLPSAYAKGEPLYDGIAEVWADDTDALRAMTRSPEHPRLIEDEAQFIDRARMGFIVTEDRVIVDGDEPPAGAVKAIELFRRRPGSSVDDFQRHWRDVHAPMVAKVPGLQRYVVSATRASAYVAGRAPAYDGANLLWFAAPEALRAAGRSAEYQAAVGDRTHFLAPGPPPFLLTREYVIVA